MSALIRKHPYFIGAMALAVLIVAASFAVWRWQSTSLPQPEGRQGALVQAATDLPTSPRNEPANQGERHKPQLTLDTAWDYDALKAELEPLAEMGDPVALRTIAQIYEYCQTYSVSPEMFREARETMSELVPENAEAYKRIADTVDARCGRLDGGDPIPTELRQFSLMQAADAGDTYAKIKLAATSGAKVSPEEIDALVDEALLGEDPQAILALGDLMGVPGAGRKYAQFSGSGAPFAWMVLACRKGRSSLCDQNSHLMTNLCLYQGVCRYSSVEDYARREVFTGEQSRKLDEIIRNIRARSQAVND